MSNDWYALLLGSGVTVAAVTWSFRTAAAVIEGRRRRRNLMRALPTEIEENLRAEEDSFTRGTDPELIAKRIREDSGYRPLIFAEQQSNPLFAALRSHFTVLPKSALPPVVRYYKEDNFTNSVINTLNSEAFLDLGEAERKVTPLELLWEQVGRATAAGHAAADALRREIGDAARAKG